MGDPTFETARSDVVPAELAADHPPERLLSDLVEAERAARYAWAAHLARGGRVLDLGCGDGSGTIAVAEAGATEVIGVEPQQRLLDVIDTASHATVTLVAADPAALPFDDDRFDLVLAFDIPDRLADPEAALAEFARVLAPGGVLALAVVDPGARPEPDPHAPVPLLAAAWRAAVAERFANVVAGRQVSRIVTELWFPSDRGSSSMEEPPTNGSTHVILLASETAAEPPPGVILDAGAAGWSDWQAAIGELRAENAALRRSLELRRRETEELADLRTALMDSEQLLAEREDLRADLRDAESDLRELIAHLRRHEVPLGRFEERVAE